ncbi:unnamed protein product [Ceratitis capitata]|uniref:(Mediterranean fruit fly) hypothetical protein n=1 Tax=Ceratitis capitata TaxID=7213 RepID=A0A811U527_CERCA|nr:unnamed protein product [Ceratitis capitata]
MCASVSISFFSNFPCYKPEQQDASIDRPTIRPYIQTIPMRQAVVALVARMAVTIGCDYVVTEAIASNYEYFQKSASELAHFTGSHLKERARSRSFSGTF